MKADLTALFVQADAAVQAAIDAQVSTVSEEDRTWRIAAHAVLKAADAILPSGCPRETVRAVYSHVYPFSQRAGHPYAIWLSECRAFLERRFPPTIEDKAKRATKKQLKKRGLTALPTEPSLFEE